MVPEKETISGPCVKVGALNPSDTDVDRSIMKFEQDVMFVDETM
jgi:hypothetical protein